VNMDATTLTPEMKLLVVDDEEMNRDMLSRRLSRKGYSVATAADGGKALSLVREQAFDLILLDIMMPGLDGMSVLKILREKYSPAQLPVIMATAKDQTDSVVNALRLGANDYVTKPIDFPVLLARIQTQVGLKRATESLAKAYRHIKEDLAQAAKVQRSLLPHAAPDVSGVQFSWIYQPCDELAGDILNVFQLDRDHVGLYLLDVSGHGVQAALMSSALSHILSSLPAEGSIVRQTEDGEATGGAASPCEVVERLNRRFQLDPDTCQYFTILYGVLDLPARTFRYVTAGHPYPVILRTDGRAVVLRNPNPAVGFVRDPHYREECVSLAAGDRVYFYSDGIVEAQDGQDVLFGEQRLIDLLASTRGASLGASLDVLTARITEWLGRPSEDDISVLAFEMSDLSDGEAS